MEIRIHKIRDINEKALVVALDIGKRVHHGYLRAPNGKEIKPFCFYNFNKSFEKSWAAVDQVKRQQNLSDIVIGFESTGPYAEPLFHYLRHKPVKLVQINPMHSKRLKELTGNSPNKTDKKDPRVIADVICLGHALAIVVPEGPAAQLRRLTQARERAIDRHTALVNQLQHLLFVIFPEFSTIMKPSPKTAMYLIKHHTTPESIFAIGLNEDRFIGHLNQQMADYLRQIPYSGSLFSIKGIGEVTAAGLIGEVGDFRKFKTISEMMKLAGLDLYEVSSGKHKGQGRISKRGRSLMRKLLFFAAINAVKSNGIMHESYQQMLDRSMPKIKALTAISRKLLRIIFALIRDNTVYVENYSQIHNFKLAA